MTRMVSCQSAVLPASSNEFEVHGSPPGAAHRERVKSRRFVKQDRAYWSRWVKVQK